MGQIQSMFDDFTSSTSVQAGLFKAIELHQSLVQFRGRLPEEFDHFERLPHPGRIDLDTEEGEKMVVRFTMCGIYLQLKMLVLLPVLQTSVWSAIRMQPLAISDELRHLTDECVRAALEMVSLRCFLSISAVLNARASLLDPSLRAVLSCHSASARSKSTRA